MVNNFQPLSKRAKVDINKTNKIQHSSSSKLPFSSSKEEKLFFPLFRIVNVTLRHFLIVNPNFSKVPSMHNLSIGFGKWSIKSLYESVAFFLKSISRYKDENTILHTALELDNCYWAFCKFLLMLHPEQCLQKDHEGNLPIHIAASLRESTDDETMTCADCCSNRHCLIHVVLKCRSIKNCCGYCFAKESNVAYSCAIISIEKLANIVPNLLLIAPQSAFISDSSGQYPLHIAIQNQQSSGIIYSILNAYLPITRIRDKKTNLYPFMLASVGEWRNEESQINVIFTLILEDPSLVAE